MIAYIRSLVYILKTFIIIKHEIKTTVRFGFCKNLLSQFWPKQIFCNSPD
ncbi:hypothetical protein ASZ90_006107 [hydrocarbon metagenome]|uniref:Uncharacterized protein n=1 Tax=hydrocarbon metagenome TaxID=938273 RepID=A0A0W8FTB6_9ZZZZ